MIKKISHKYHNKRITTRDNGNDQSYDQEECKLISTIKANSGPHILCTWLNNNKKAHLIKIT